MTQEYVLITRPETDSRLLQKKLEKERINSLIFPTLSIHPIEFKYDVSALKKSDGVIITSKHTASYLPSHSIKDDIPIYSIGKETTKSLQENGFSVSYTADGNSLSLSKIIKEKAPGNSRFFHFGGEDISKAFKEYILNRFPVTHISVYKAVAAVRLPSEIIESLKRKQITRILLFSSRSAKIFERLCENADVTENLKHIQALCLAPSVVKSLDKRKWEAIHCAETPNTAAMIVKLKSDRKSQE